MMLQPTVDSFRRGFLLGLAGLLFATVDVPSALASDPPPPASDRLVFCAYNVKNWLRMDRFNQSTVERAAPKPESEKAAVIRILVSLAPDVIGLSEIGTLEDLKEIQKLLKKSGLDLPEFELAQGEDQDRRLGLLSSFPISSRQSRSDLSYKMNQETKLIQRGLLDVTISPRADLPLRFMGVHFKSMREIPGMDQALMRRNEAQLARQHIDAVLETQPDTPILLYGDFNEHRNGVPIKTVIGSRTSPNYMEELLVTDINGELWTHFWDAADSYARLDYLFFSRSLKPLILKEASFIYQSRDFLAASDHRPLVTVLQLPSPAPATGP